MSETATVRDDLKVGGHYTAVDNGDGTYNILDVCVFTEIPAGVKRNKDPIGRDWQEAALMQSKAREANGHLPPVHIYHSDEVAVKPVYAGKMRLKAVRQTTYEGSKLWGTFADILGMPADVFEKIRKGFLSYRSVEIHNWAKPEIDSLALMDTDVPFFRMPMLTVGRVLQKDAEMFTDKSRPSWACRSDKIKQGGLVLFRFAERGDMPDKEDEEDDKDPALNAKPEDAKETSDEGPGSDAPKGEDDGLGGDLPEKGPGGAEMEAEGEAGEAGEAGHDDAPQDAQMMEKALAPLMSMLQSFGTLLKQLNNRLGPQAAPNEKLEAVNGVNLGQEATGTDFKNKEDDEMADPKDPKATESKITFASRDELKSFMGEVVNEAVLKATAPLMADVATFKADREKAAKQNAAQVRFDAAKKELVEAGCHVDADLEKFLFKAADVSEEFLKEQVAVFKTRLPKEPPTDGAEFEAGLQKEAVDAVDGDEVNAFLAEHGPRWGAWAKKQAAAFRAFQAGGGTDTSLEEWLSINFRSETMSSRNKV